MIGATLTSLHISHAQEIEEVIASAYCAEPAFYARAAGKMIVSSVFRAFWR